MSDGVWIAIITFIVAPLVIWAVKDLSTRTLARQKRVQERVTERSSTSEAVKLHELSELAAVRLQQTRDIEALEAERERWQRDYYKLRDAFNSLIRQMLTVFQSLRYQLAVQQAKDALALIEKQIDELSKLDPPKQEKHE